MTNSRDHSLPADLSDIDERLRGQRQEPSAIELDELGRRIGRRVTDSSRSRRRVVAPRLAVMLALVVGMMFSGAGAALAISGISSSGSASVAQYGGNGVGPGAGNKTPGNQNSGGNGVGPGGGNNNPGGNAPENAVQETRQVGAVEGGKSLPFTGYLAIPVLLIGIALMASGLVLRRRASD